VNLSSIVKAIGRRWYIFVPGFILSLALASAAHIYVHPTFTRTADLVLIPDQASIPKGANPYLYVGGLTSAADILVRAAGAESATSPITQQYPGSSITIVRDTTTAGPVIEITVDAPRAADTGALISDSVAAVSTQLQQLQSDEHLSGDQMITSTQLAEDTTATPKTKTQLMATLGAGIGGLAVTLILTNMLDGVLLARRQRRRRGSAGAQDVPTDGESAAPSGVAEPQARGGAVALLLEHAKRA
jgi:hypothetical protein